MTSTLDTLDRYIYYPREKLLQWLRARADARPGVDGEAPDVARCDAYDQTTVSSGGMSEYRTHLTEGRVA